MDIEVWLKQQISEEAGVPVNEISNDDEFENFKLDSLSLVSLAFELEKVVDKEIDPTVFTEFNTINKLTKWVKSQK